MICLAPRALGESVRPRRPAGVVVRPLNFTVRWHAMVPAFGLALVFLLPPVVIAVLAPLTLWLVRRLAPASSFARLSTPRVLVLSILQFVLYVGAAQHSLAAAILGMPLMYLAKLEWSHHLYPGLRYDDIYLFLVASLNAVLWGVVATRLIGRRRQHAI